MELNYKFWIRFCLINLLIVALLGVIMRYKIGFEFPIFDQKHLQLAHSNFALSGWITTCLMVLMLYSIRDEVEPEVTKSFNKLLWANIFSSYGMLVTYLYSGFSVASVLFSCLYVVVSIWFSIKIYFQFKELDDLPGIKWMNGALLFYILSTVGMISLGYMMVTRQFDQHLYLASMYWTLHFQYNGWFFFACMGLLINYLYERDIFIEQEDSIFRLFALTCVPAYGLSILWLDLPRWFYIIVVIATTFQSFAVFLLLARFLETKIFKRITLDTISKAMYICVSVALIAKFALQAGSIVPAISKFAFGFRPIVIAYLHLALLAFITVFLIGYCYINQLIISTKQVRVGLFLFLIGVVLNELILGIQGIASFTYTLVPWANIMLFVAALIIFAGLILLNLSSLRTRGTKV